MYQSGTAGNEAKKRKSPAKSGRVGITVFSKTQRDVSLLKKFLVSWNEPRELENIDTFIDSFLLMNTTTHKRSLKLKSNNF